MDDKPFNLSRREMGKLRRGTALAILALAPVLTFAYPTKPITLVIPFNAGSAPDTTYRILAAEAEKELGQKFVVHNRPGAGGTIGVKSVAQAAPDGYTIGMAAVAILLLQPLVIDATNPGPDDVMPLVQSNEAPVALAVNAGSPWRTMNDLLAEARKRPGEVSVGIGGGPHNILHVQVALLEKSAGVRFNAIPYGAGQQFPALLGGVIDFASAQTALINQHVKAGKLRALAQVAPERVKGLEDVPTLKELGHNVTQNAYEFLFAPKGIPPAALERLAGAFRKAVESDTFRDYGNRTGLIILYLGPKELAERLRADSKTYRQVVDEFGWAKKK
ncbi:MAG: tripartite tricarboxylate transporter substrate binding protein [Burkholderiales bacterium]